MKDIYREILFWFLNFYFLSDFAVVVFVFLKEISSSSSLSFEGEIISFCLENLKKTKTHTHVRFLFYSFVVVVVSYNVI